MYSFFFSTYRKLRTNMFILLCILSIVFIPSVAEAWGPYTHIYLGHQVLNFGIPFLPASVYALLKRYKGDFLYGNLSADIILGKRFQRLEKNSHSWGVAWEVFKAAKTYPQKAFAYGYLTHLSADTVVHNLEKTKLPFKHSLLEVKSDSLIDKKYKSMVKELNKSVHKRHDIFLERLLDSGVLSFKTNKKLFNGILFLSKAHHYKPVCRFIDKRFSRKIPVMDIYNFQQESLGRMFELLQNGEKSKVLKKNPAKEYRRIRRLGY